MSDDGADWKRTEEETPACYHPETVYHCQYPLHAVPRDNIMKHHRQQISTVDLKSILYI